MFSLIIHRFQKLSYTRVAFGNVTKQYYIWPPHITIWTRSQRNPLFLSGFKPPSFNWHNAQECLSSKLVLLSPCCALLLWVLQSSHGSQARKQQCQCVSLLVPCASPLIEMVTTPNNILPVCLSKPNQAKFSILSPHLTTPFNLTISFKLTSTVALFPRYSVTTNNRVKEPSGAYVKDMGGEVRQYWTPSVLERRVPHLYYVGASWNTTAPVNSASYN